MKRLIPLLFITLFSLLSQAQSPTRLSIKGRVQDKENQIWLTGATVVCRYAKDSTSAGIRLTDTNGSFAFDSLLPENYILYITFLGYQSLTKEIKLQFDNTATNLGIITLSQMGVMLSQVEVVEMKKKARISKDTIEFNTSSFALKENALVEDLLRKIPGIQIDKGGNISVNGLTVSSIMIDGRPLFGSGDPKIISRNLQASLIDKVQLIDQNADRIRSAIPGSAEASKIINITIKKSKKNLFTGELNTAYGTSNRFETKVNLSRFNEHQQILILGNGDNTNGSTDNQYYSSGSGIQRTWNTGASYIQDIGAKTTINTSYLMNNIKSDEMKNSLRQSTIKDSSLLNNQQSQSNTATGLYSFSTQIEYRIDSSQKIILSNQLTFDNSNNRLSDSYESIGDNSKVLNKGTITNNERDKNSSIFSSIRYEKKFQKKGRFLSSWFSYGNSTSKGIGYYISQNLYYPANNESISDTINQYMNKQFQNAQLFLMLNYTEPITKNGYLIVSFAEDHAKGISDRLAYNYNMATKTYDIINDSLSNKYESNPTQHLAKIGWLFKTSRLDYTLALTKIWYELNSKDVVLNNTISINSKKVLPEINFNYLINSEKRLRFSYRKTPLFPQMSQLQPVNDGKNPILIKRGNPALKPMNTDDLYLSYNAFNNNTLRSHSITIGARFMQDQIINASSFDSLGRQLIQPINVTGAHTINFNMDNSFPSRSRKGSLNLNTKAIIEKALSYTNGDKGTNRNIFLTQSINYNYSYKKLLEFSISGNVNYNNALYESRIHTISNYLNYGLSFLGSINLPWGININANCNYVGITGRMNGYNTNSVILNASISKAILSHQQGVIKIQGVDLLKQNVSVRRTIQDNYIEDTKSNILERFFTIRFSYFIGKNK